MSIGRQLWKDWGRHYALPVALLFFYAFNYTNNQLYAIWMSCPIHEDVSWVFQLLSWLPKHFCIDTCTPILEKFISYVYVTKNPDNGKNVNEVKLLQYSSSAKEGFQVLLPSSDSLGLHTKRCCYQAGWVWGTQFHRPNPPRQQSGADN